MDDTIDALASRLEGRHVVDELLGYFRSRRSNGEHNGNGRHIREQAAESAGAITHAVVDGIRRHPLPAALIGSGIAWIIYENRRRSEEERYYDELLLVEEEFPEQGMIFEGEYNVEEDYGRSGFEGEEHASGSRLGRAKDKLKTSAESAAKRSAHLGQRVKSRASAARYRMEDAASPLAERTRGGMSAARERARRARRRMRETAGNAGRRSREEIDRHPLEAGLLSLAGGLIAGLLTPNPRKLDEWAGPAARDLKEQARDRAGEMVERGKRVASVAARTAQEEAAAEGLTPDALKRKAEAVVEETKEAAQESARQAANEQELTPEALKQKTGTVLEETKRAASDSARQEKSAREEIGTDDRVKRGGEPGLP